MKVMTILGTRPEIIRLASVIKMLDKHCDHVLVHTGQNYDRTLNDIFFEDLDLRLPDHVLETKSETIQAQIAAIIEKTGDVMDLEKPDAIVILGDTNSGLSAIPAKRKKIPIFHIEAGDRSFDHDVPEELNRRIVDHTSDVNMAYTEHSRRNLLREGAHPRNVYVVGSPVCEVYDGMQEKFANSKILEELNLEPGNFLTASIHREENVDKGGALETMVDTFNALAEKYACPIVVSTHPRTRRRLEQLNLLACSNPLINWHEPFGLIDFIRLQTESKCVISDSGTIHEDSAILGFPAVAIRKSTEKQESLEAGYCPITGLHKDDVLRAVGLVVDDPIDFTRSPAPEAYQQFEVSKKITRIILGMTRVIDEQVWGPKDKKFV
ncbi:non-hydrolyzing UDP-N-acetylglucosamine 2-epimerase [Aestuariispira insulae]|uniref:UDP-N-acetylglucosamine 2-epimerase (Non-hydrolysing) n=1 Tax=Aestuariispira insulae TaxID=1461337 RepID=A0A3D9H4C4_9PROT|nr:UDP-N-acetylglucosamine 2-epimerase (non-hydrolyzing) [Aestuariispira insulae]RED44309.1 UDP-N-acetylglucosamine 2-epimerase (non-hydrolysing) [Aestuariispira insulae]